MCHNLFTIFVNQFKNMNYISFSEKINNNNERYKV